jgi:hypothetical protein
VDLFDRFGDEDLEDVEVSLELRGLVPIELQILKPKEE